MEGGGMVFVRLYQACEARNQSSVRLSPSRQETRGCQPSTARARLISRTFTGTSNRRGGRYRRSMGRPMRSSRVVINSFRLQPSPEPMLKMRWLAIMVHRHEEGINDVLDVDVVACHAAVAPDIDRRAR